ncbi:MAG TPA: sigma-70 family RNA polymerase sigma factor [Thermoanaerobaculia bacterium]|nr:sigma-70 family RNA polymerase sigma factor [Thermoanaerobaculia bacterium]
MNDDPLEARLIARVQEGDAEAYDALVSKYLRRVVAIAFSIVRNAHDAEDLAQEAFVKAYQSIGRFRAGAPFGPWIGRIVTNLAFDVVKHRRRFRHESIDEIQPSARRDDADLGAMQRDAASRIDAALDELPEMQRIVARLHLVEEMEHAEIAAVTGLSQGTVRSHLSLARTKLKAKLADLYD